MSLKSPFQPTLISSPWLHSSSRIRFAIPKNSIASIYLKGLPMVNNHNDKKTYLNPEHFPVLDPYLNPEHFPVHRLTHQYRHQSRSNNAQLQKIARMKMSVYPALQLTISFASISTDDVLMSITVENVMPDVGIVFNLNEITVDIENAVVAMANETRQVHYLTPPAKGNLLTHFLYISHQF